MFLDFVKSLIDGATLEQESGPTIEIGEGEEILGEMPDDLKKMYMVFSASAKDMSRLSEGQSIGDILQKPKLERTQEENVLIQQHMLAHNRYERIKDLFWHEIEERFPEALSSGRGCGVRKGWLVVSLAETADEFPGMGIMVIGSISVPIPQRRRGILQRIFGG